VKYIKIGIVFILLISVSQAQAGSGSTNLDLMSKLKAQKTTRLSPGECLVDPEVIDNVTPLSAALVFNDPDSLAQPFALSKTLNAIAQGGTTSSSAAELIASMIDSHSKSSAKNIDSNLEMPVLVKTREQNISPQAAVDEWVPVGLFNRFDTAPLDGSHCGEYRIVYANPGDAQDSSLQGFPNRFLTIFEAAIPNPLPSEGINGCLPIAKFWASLANGKNSTDLTSEEKVAAVAQLEKFYYQGIETEYFGQPITIGPVVKFEHYQSPLGQVRTNEFLTFRWQLREFRTALDGNGKAIFKVDTVKNNALAELFNTQASFNQGSTSNIEIFESLRVEFQNTLKSDLLSQLTLPDATAQNSFELLNLINLNVPNRFNEFQSEAQNTSDDVSLPTNTDQTLRNDITNALVQINDALGNSSANNNLLTQQHIFNRIEATTCGGCHQLSNSKVVGVTGSGEDIRWPRTSGFVHINEEGALSPALIDTFLPARETVLKNFICNSPAPAKFELQQTQLRSTRGKANKWSKTVFLNDYDTPPVVFANASAKGNDPCHTRIRNITADSFQSQCLETVEDGGHPKMNIDYLALKLGVTNLGDKKIETQCVNIGTNVGKNNSNIDNIGWTPVIFDSEFDDTPVVMSQIISDNNGVLLNNITAPSLWLTAAVRNVSKNGFEATLDRSTRSSNLRSIAAETICFAAFEKGAFQLKGDDQQESANCEVNTLEAQGWEDSCQFSSPLTNLKNLPLSVGGKQDRNGSNGGWVRKRCNSTAAGVNFVIDEDTKRRSHKNETVGYLACDQAVKIK
jgi:hypothetical protein